MDAPKLAIVGYDPGSKAWYAASLKNAEGVYIDPVRVSPAVASLLDDIGQGINHITLKTFQALCNEAKGERPKKRRA